MNVSTQSIYHKLLRINALLFTFLLLFSGGFLFPVTSQLTNNTAQYVASVAGVDVATDFTEVNTSTASVNPADEISSRDISTYVLSIILFIIIVLLLLNYALDLSRQRHEQ